MNRQVDRLPTLPALLILPRLDSGDERAAKGQHAANSPQAIPYHLISLPPKIAKEKTYRDGGCHAGVPGDLKEAALVVEQTHGGVCVGVVGARKGRGCLCDMWVHLCVLCCV